MKKNMTSLDIVTERRTSEKEKKSKKLPLVLGLIFGGIGIAAGVGMMVYSCNRQKRITLTFNVGDATIISGSNQQLLSKEMTFGNINKPEVMKDTYMFEGWYYDSAFKKPVSDKDKISANTTIYLNMVSDGYNYLDFTAGESGATLTGNTRVAILPGKKFKEVNKPSATWNDGKQFKYWESGGVQIQEDQEIIKSDRLTPKFDDPIAGHTELEFQTVGKSYYTGTTRFTVPEKTIFQTCTTPTAILTGKVFNKWQYKNTEGEIVDIPANWEMPQGKVYIYPNFDEVDLTTKITITQDGIQYWLTNPTASTGNLIFMDADGKTKEFDRYVFNETVTIGSNITAIDTSFMANCTAFNNGSKELIIPSKVEMIGNSFLENCLSFNQKVDLSSCSKLSKINPSFMYNCVEFNSPLEFPTTYESSSFTMSSNFLYNCSKFNQPISLPTMLTEIPSCFLEGCATFNQKINFPAGINYIGPYFLARCTSFNNNGNNLELPAAITEITDSFLYYCTSFKNVNLVLPANLVSIGNSFMFNCSAYNGTLLLPTSLVSIGNYFLYQNTVFNSDLNISNLEALTTIGTNFMNYCEAFTQSFELKNNITSIGKWFMYTCYNFTGPLTISCSVSAFSSGDKYTLAVNKTGVKALSPGITINGANATEFKNTFTNSSDKNPFRVLV